MFVSFEKILRASAWAATATVIAMIVVFLTTGVGQDPLQFIHAPAEYMQLLLANPPALRAAVGLDNFFIVFYSTAFLSLGVILLRDGAHRGLVQLTVGLLLGVALLDMIENHHFLAMLARAELGDAPSASEIELQVIESLIKFHVSYLGLFLLGFALPRRGRGERVLASLSWYVQLPVGILIYVTPRSLSVPLVFVRFGYFLVALAMVGVLFGRCAEPLSERAAAG